MENKKKREEEKEKEKNLERWIELVIVCCWASGTPVHRINKICEELYIQRVRNLRGENKKKEIKRIFGNSYNMLVCSGL
jgi:diphthamide synthase (EF-2-diphthine--ammonia ligase)